MNLTLTSLCVHMPPVAPKCPYDIYLVQIYPSLSYHCAYWLNTDYRCALTQLYIYIGCKSKKIIMRLGRILQQVIILIVKIYTASEFYAIIKFVFIFCFNHIRIYGMKTCKEYEPRMYMWAWIKPRCTENLWPFETLLCNGCTIWMGKNTWTFLVALLQSVWAIAIRMSINF